MMANDQLIKVSDALPGSVVQVVLLGPSDHSGNYYRISRNQPPICGVTVMDGVEIKKVRARRQFTGEVLYLAGCNDCRVITGEIEGFRS